MSPGRRRTSWTGSRARRARPCSAGPSAELESGLVDEPALLARDLEREDVVRVVVDGQALRLARREVRVRLRRVAELALEHAAELGEGWPVEVQPLEDERRARLELGRTLPTSAVPLNGPGATEMSFV